MEYDETINDIQDLYADLSACFLAISNALEASGTVSKEQIAESFQERLLAMQPSGIPDSVSPHPFVLLRSLAVSLGSSPSRYPTRGMKHRCAMTRRDVGMLCIFTSQTTLRENTQPYRASGD